MNIYIRVGNIPLENAHRYSKKEDAIKHFKMIMQTLYNVGQDVEASLHIAATRKQLKEYPDYLLSRGKRGGVKVEKT